MEGPQICTRARRLDYEVIPGRNIFGCAASGSRSRAWLKVSRPGRGGSRRCYFYRTRDTCFRANGLLASIARTVCFTGSTCPATCTTRAETPLRGFTVSYHGYIEPSEFPDGFSPRTRDSSISAKRAIFPIGLSRAYEQQKRGWHIRVAGGDDAGSGGGVRRHGAISGVTSASSRNCTVRR